MTRSRRVLALAAICACAAVACGKSDESSKQQSQKPAAGYTQSMPHEHANDRPAASPATQARRRTPVKSQQVVYGSVNGQELRGYLAYPADAEGGLPGVLVFHEWWGLNDNIRAMANQLAGEGYVALAADVY